MSNHFELNILNSQGSVELTYPSSRGNLGDILVLKENGVIGFENLASNETLISGSTIKNQTGGSNGHVVRLVGADTWVDATSLDSISQLYCLAFKWNESYYLPNSYIYDSSYSFLLPNTVGSIYYLDTVPGLTILESIPSSGANYKKVPIGKAISDFGFFFSPGLIIGG